MKAYFTKMLATCSLIAFSLSPLSAAEEKYEEFARKFLPQTQKICEEMRQESIEANSIKNNLSDKLTFDMDSYPVCRALVSKICSLDREEAEWAKWVKEYYFKYKGKLISPSELMALDKEKSTTKAKLKTIIENRFKSSAFIRFVPCVPVPNKDFEIGIYEVTQAEYELIMGENPSSQKGLNLPVEVSWEDAIKFCARLTNFDREKGLIAPNQEFRLPTPDEWEYCCRAGTTTKYCSGDTEADLSYVAWYSKNSEGKPHAVGTKTPNAWGIYDMHGNVEEWNYNTNRYPRIACGGSSAGKADDCDASSRSKHGNDREGTFVGFRVVLAPAQK